MKILEVSQGLVKRKLKKGQPKTKVINPETQFLLKKVANLEKALKQPTPKRVVKPKVVKAKVHRPKSLPKGPKTAWQKEWDRGMRLNRKFIDINVARELALKKDRQIATLIKQNKAQQEQIATLIKQNKAQQDTDQKKIRNLEQEIVGLKQQQTTKIQPGHAYNLVVDKLQESVKDTELQELRAFKKQVLSKPLQHRKKKK